MNCTSKPVTVVITCMIKADKLTIAKEALASVIKTVIAEESACHGIRVHEAPDNPCHLLIVEYWASKDDFSGLHMQTPHMIEFMKIAQSFLDGEARFDFWNEISKSI